VDNKAVVGGDIVGSVFADDSTLLVDAVNGNIPGYISLADLKTHVASSADFAAFKTTIAGL
jgi:inosine/xanthosine triphosphate pyrophosphatase family protein